MVPTSAPAQRDHRSRPAARRADTPTHGGGRHLHPTLSSRLPEGPPRDHGPTREPQNPHEHGVLGDGRYWARTSDLRLVDSSGGSAEVPGNGRKAGFSK